MAKFQHLPGPSAPAFPPSSPSPQQQQVVLKQDLAKLVDKDPDTRRSAMDALKAYIEGELDVQSMPYFLEQVSGESNKGEASRTYAISLFVEVARVHNQLTIPYIPRIMATVVRSLHSSAGSQNLHQACANVVSSVARYAIEQPAPGAPSRGDEVLRGLCHPLLGIVCSKVEPVAVGGATCLQALIESEKWKFAAPDLVSNLCYRAAMAVGEKGTQTVAHMSLVRSLAKFNSEALHEYGAQLLKAGVEILLAAAGACGSWQQRAAAAQLLTAVLRVADERTLVSELAPITEALERCRLDKVHVVRRAIGEALEIAKSLTAEMDNLLLQNGGLQEAETPSRRLSEPRRRGRRRSMCRTDEGSRSRAKNRISCTLESNVVPYASSPSSLSSLSVSASPLSSTASSITSSGRSPLFPAKQSPAMLPSFTGQCTTESGLEYLLARLKSSESKENAPLIGKLVEPPLSMKSDDTNDIFHWSKGSMELGENGGTTDYMEVSPCEVEQESFSVISAENPVELSLASIKDNDTLLAMHGRRNLKCADSLSLSSGITDSDMDIQTISSYGSRTFPKVLDEGTDQEQGLDFLGDDDLLDDGGSEAKRCQQGNGGQDNCGHPVANVRYNSLAHVVNLEAAVSPQMVKTRMAAEDFLLFATPRRLVRSLQSASSTPESRMALDGDMKEELEMECETLSESGWSVRDNPIADDSEDDSLKGSPLADLVLKQDMSASLKFCSQNVSMTSDRVEHMVSSQECGKLGLASQRHASLSAAVEPLTSAESCEPCFVGNNLGHMDGDRLKVKSLSADVEPLSSADSCHQVCDKKKVGHTDEQSKVKVQSLEILNLDPTDNIPLTESETCLVTAQDNSKEGNREKGLRHLCVREWTPFVTRCRKAQEYTEVFLSGALCAVMVFGMAIVIGSCLNGKNDIHVLVPT